MKRQLTTASRAPAEAGSIAAELARAYRQMVTFHRDQLGLSAVDQDLSWPIVGPHEASALGPWWVPATSSWVRHLKS